MMELYPDIDYKNSTNPLERRIYLLWNHTMRRFDREGVEITDIRQLSVFDTALREQENYKDWAFGSRGTIALKEGSKELSSNTMELRITQFDHRGTEIVGISPDGRKFRFSSSAEASRKLNIPPMSISNCITGRQRKTRGWQFYREDS